MSFHSFHLRALIATTVVTAASWLGESRLLAQPIRSPASVVGTSLGTYNDPNVSLANMVNQTGLDVPFTSGVTDFDAYFAGSPPKYAQAIYTNNWQSQYVSSLPLAGTIDFDFGTILNVSKVAIWNISLENVDIQLSDTEGGPFQTVKSVKLTNNTFNSFSYTVDIIELGGTFSGRYFRLQANSAYQISNQLSGTYAIVGEVAVRATEGGTPPPPEGSARLTNLSVRSGAGSGDQTLIVGFAVQGAEQKPVLIRGIGPSLTGFGVTGALEDPTLLLYAADTGPPIDENDNWGGGAGLADLFDTLGAFSLEAASLDSALSRSLQSGGYTAHVTSNSGAGIGLAEIYDTDNAADAALVNISARSFVGTGNDILIAGFVVTGDAPIELLIRGIGLELAQYGVSGVLEDPQLKVFAEGSAVPIAENDNWERTTAMENAFGDVGAFGLPENAPDSALLVTLDPGVYTAQVSGVGDATGIALVEIYALP